MKKLYNHKNLAFLLLLLGFFSGCDDFVKIDPPRTALVKETVFDNDVTADAAMLDLYYQLQTYGFASGGPTSISLWGTYLTDEQINYYQSGLQSTDAAYQQFNDNELLPNNSEVLNLWKNLYSTIYRANAIIEGVAASSGISEDKRNQLEGEAKFVRSLCHFYLVNLWGDVPLVLTTDYRINSKIPRTPKDEVYERIIDDLIDAENLLPADYSFSNNERVRVTKGAVNAFLARVYLYLEDWANAEIRSTTVITNSGLYALTGTVEEIFLVNSSEAILQWWSQQRPNDRGTFRSGFEPAYGALRPSFATSFDPNDLRNIWVNLNFEGYYNARKYTLGIDFPPIQYSTAFRLGEQYLIRAEARAHLNNISGSQDDINTIRNRAGLPDTPANDEASLLLAIEDERKFELFTEWGHRWFDLVRTNRAETVLSPIKPQWDATDILLPIPEREMIDNPGLAGSQNPGY